MKWTYLDLPFAICLVCDLRRFQPDSGWQERFGGIASIAAGSGGEDRYVLIAEHAAVGEDEGVCRGFSSTETAGGFC